MASYLVSIATFAGIYAILTLGLNVMWGLTGMINLGLAGFFAVGAYASALVTTALGAPIWLGFATSAVAAALAGAVLTASTLRLRGDYLAIVTLGFAELVRLIASNEIWLTRGTDGISGIPGPLRGALSPADFNLLYFGLVVLGAGAVLVLTQRIAFSPFGRVLRSIRDDDGVAAVAGKHVARFKIAAFALGSAILGLAGAFYAHYTSYIAPDIFRPLITIYIFLALTAGGTGNGVGALVGALIVMAIHEGTRFLAAEIPGLSGVQAAALREFTIGAALIVMMRVRPRGLIPEPVPMLGPAAEGGRKARP
jgi:branched-chain amino acid transport system permease protein